MKTHIFCGILSIFWGVPTLEASHLSSSADDAPEKQVKPLYVRPLTEEFVLTLYQNCAFLNGKRVYFCDPHPSPSELYSCFTLIHAYGEGKILTHFDKLTEGHMRKSLPELWIVFRNTWNPHSNEANLSFARNAQAIINKNLIPPRQVVLKDYAY